MSSFYCETCGAECLYSPRGYTTECEHYPPDAPISTDSLDNLVDKRRNPAAIEGLAE